MKLLLVDDDLEQLDLLSYALRRQGYEVLTAADGEQGLARWRADEPDLVILDGMMPKLNGFEATRRIRDESTTPVILLTARSQEADEIHGLQMGADDYVAKPFSAKQLAARIEAVLRRTGRGRLQRPKREIHAGELILDVDSHHATRAGRSAKLTKLEFQILHLLVANEGKVLPYSRLVEYVWGYFTETNSELLKTHIAHLRRKLGLPAEGPGSIQAITGVGYLLARAPAPRATGPGSLDAIGARRSA